MERRRIRWRYLKTGIEIDPGSVKVTDRLSLPKLRDAIVQRGFIYIIPSRDLVKIGKTRDSIYRRWHTLKVGNPWLEPPLYVSPPLWDNFHGAELVCHEELAMYRVTGEWFKCQHSVAIDIVKRVVEEFLTEPNQ